MRHYILKVETVRISKHPQYISLVHGAFAQSKMNIPHFLIENYYIPDCVCDCPRAINPLSQY